MKLGAPAQDFVARCLPSGGFENRYTLPERQGWAISVPAFSQQPGCRSRRSPARQRLARPASSMLKKLLHRKSASRWLGAETQLELEKHFTGRQAGGRMAGRWQR